jgi:hypothetical protein
LRKDSDVEVISAKEEAEDLGRRGRRKRKDSRRRMLRGT